MCFGLSSAPFTCCKLLDIVLGDMPKECCVHYFDDVILHGKTFDEVLSALDEALSRFQEAGLTLNLAKCQFFKPHVTFLGHVVSRDGMSTDPEKVAKVRDWPQPRTKKELLSFLGLCSYFKKYVGGFAVIASPLFDLTRKEVSFQWSSRADEAFLRLKRALCDAPVVGFPRFGAGAGMFTLDCDASNEGIGAVLLQEQDGVQRVIAYGSHRLSKAQRNYSTTKKELLACVTFVQDFSHYLMGKAFQLRTDHSSLQWLLNFRNPTGMLARWMEILGNFQFQIVYRPGEQNSAADALSRRPSPVADKGCQTESCFRVSARDWPLSYIQGEQGKDEVLAEVIRLVADCVTPSRGTVSGGVRRWLRHWSRLRLIEGVLFRVYRSGAGGPENLQVIIPSGLVGGVLTSLHAGPCGGHFGSEKLLKQTQTRFYWLEMAADVAEFCAQCDRCSGRNSPHPRPRAPMGELYASEPWEVLSIDFLTDLPLTERGNKHLLVCCDHFTRWVEVFALPDMTAVTVARVLAEEVFSRYGCPRRLHSDCAANFRSQVIAELCRIMGIDKSNTTAFHPEGNSRCERVNRTVLGMLSKYLSDNHAEWDLHLPLLMLGYRAQIHRSLGYSPFHLMFGREPKLPVDAAIDAPCVVRSRSAAEYIDGLCAGLRDAYRQALKFSDAGHRRNKRLYDQKSRTFHFAEGDRVMLFCAVAKKGEYHKFLRPWKPAIVVSRKGEVYYRVRLESGKVVSVHHNRLKPHRSPPLAGQHRAQDEVSSDGHVPPTAATGAGRPDSLRAESLPDDTPPPAPDGVVGPDLGVSRSPEGDDCTGGPLSLTGSGESAPSGVHDCDDPVPDDPVGEHVQSGGLSSVEVDAMGSEAGAEGCLAEPTDPDTAGGLGPQPDPGDGVEPPVVSEQQPVSEEGAVDPVGFRDRRDPPSSARGRRQTGRTRVNPRAPVPPERTLPPRSRNPPDRLCLYLFREPF